MVNGERMELFRSFILDLKGIKYTSSKTLSGEVTMDKILSKIFMSFIYSFQETLTTAGSKNLNYLQTKSIKDLTLPVFLSEKFTFQIIFRA
jgi:hypothetical protein